MMMPPSAHRISRLSERTKRHLALPAVGLIILFAAVMKCHELLTVPLAETGIATSRWFMIALVEFEFALGLCLITGLGHRHVWRASVVCLSGFLCITCFKIWNGDRSCGCFGRLSVDPRITLLLDTGMLLTLALCRPTQPYVSTRSTTKAMFVSIVLFAVALPVGFGIAATQARRATDQGEALGNGSIVILEPNKWMDQPIPILQNIDVGNALAKGDWIIVLHRHDCPICEEVLPVYRQAATALAGFGEPKIAFVEIPPFAANRERSATSDAILEGELQPVKQWFVTTPAVLALHDGTVVGVHEDSRHVDVNALRAMFERKPVHLAAGAAAVVSRRTLAD
jgi:hypothetical protein